MITLEERFLDMTQNQQMPLRQRRQHDVHRRAIHHGPTVLNALIKPLVEARAAGAPDCRATGGCTGRIVNGFSYRGRTGTTTLSGGDSADV
ncbi:MAG: hypothetical protein WCD21_07865 [Streptomyces sp.]